ncbi:hypothetical protein HMPREF1173_02456 [Prevotella nigrescens CC14M]|uniref:Uncharacterized protein n=1 Tax=Prevotella nigrescens CC14M TaxID=1073366 RepID=V8CCA0_9BACT|nr:hypothetical protein HMPREF0662_01703 [Prevotella nigrescens F0103]ETD24650.1 hypothetical protein HMPREF1173_02456 [Prevotella nigrescens CC14M]SUB93249.1 Uncharacterised protein [Prevotella nigrescens]
MHIYSVQKYYKIMTRRSFLGEKRLWKAYKCVILTKSKQAFKTKCYLIGTQNI